MTDTFGLGLLAFQYKSSKFYDPTFAERSKGQKCLPSESRAGDRSRMDLCRPVIRYPSAWTAFRAGRQLVTPVGKADTVHSCCVCGRDVGVGSRRPQVWDDRTPAGTETDVCMVIRCAVGRCRPFLCCEGLFRGHILTGGCPLGEECSLGVSDQQLISNPSRPEKSSSDVTWAPIMERLVFANFFIR